MIKEYCSVVQSPIGEVSIFADSEAVVKISFMTPANPAFNENEWSSIAAKQLTAYFEGNLQAFVFPQEQPGTLFQQGVWQALIAIPYGTTMSYAKFSEQLGNRKAIRAIAAANGKNNLAIVIPCHRVIGSSGKLVGYAGELWRKQWLLNHEREISQQGQLLLNF